MEWVPHVTVATVVEKDQHFLMVEEYANNGRLVYNQPAGHLEANESLIQAAQRETLEETGWEVEITAVLGLALYTSPHNHITYYRTSFVGQPIRHITDQGLDESIERVVWLSYEELLENADKMRSPHVITTVQQYLAGHRYPLEMIYSTS